MIKYAIFDLDGTLLDSSKVWEDLGERYLSQLGIAPDKGLSKRLSELSLAEGAGCLKREYSLPYSETEILGQLTRIIERFYREDVQPKSGALDLLFELRSRGIKMSVATAGDRGLGMSALSRLGAAEFFAGAVSGAKTSPEVYFSAAELIGAQPVETLVFEDALFAVKTAKSAGFVTAAVFDAGEARQEELRNFSDFYEKSLSEYAKNIEKILK